MGCGQSKIETEEAVTRCRDRKEFMKRSVASRNAFAAAHSLYAISLKNTGAALSDYGQGEVQHSIPSSASSIPPLSSAAPASASIASTSGAAIVQPPIDTPLPPPPPLPPQLEPAPPLQRAASMPDLAIPKKQPPKPLVDDVINEEDGDSDDEEDGDESEEDGLQHRRRGGQKSQPPPPPVAAAAESSSAGNAWLNDYFFDTENMPVPSLSQPEPEVVQEKVPPAAEPEPVAAPAAPQPAPAPVKLVKKQKTGLQYQNVVPAGGGGESRRGRTERTGPSVNLLKVLEELDDHFLKASESAYEVSKMLEATRMHYHSNFADNRGHIDHSARLMRVITWNKSCKGLKEEDNGKDDFDDEESETHATILDKMLAWEKKLYDEVKAGEQMKIEYQRKVASLNKQKKQGASPETIEKTKAAVSHLHTRYIVDMQSMDSTVSEINRLRDKQLYPRLVDLVDGTAKMWETMYIQHSSQLKIATALRNLDTSLSPKETTDQHHKRTKQLVQVLFEWHSRFQNFIKYQKEYIQALNNWLKLNLIPIESNLKEKVSSPPRAIKPAVQPLLTSWHDLLEKLPDERARSVINTFAEVVNNILIAQKEELKLKEKCEDTKREYLRKARAFDDWYQKYSEKKAAAAEAAAEGEAAAQVADPESTDRDEVVAERRAVVESLMMRLKDDEQSYQRICRQVREKSVGSLKTHLPELFRALSDFALDCSEMYQKLRAITVEPKDTVEVN